MFFTELLANLSGSTVIFASIIATLAGIFAVSYSQSCNDAGKDNR
jgi:multicomponent K+:H+ antiporter subunit A